MVWGLGQQSGARDIQKGFLVINYRKFRRPEWIWEIKCFAVRSRCFVRVPILVYLLSSNIHLNPLPGAYQRLQIYFPAVRWSINAVSEHRIGNELELCQFAAPPFRMM